MQIVADMPARNGHTACLIKTKSGKELIVCKEYLHSLNNRKKARLITYANKSKSIKQWSEELHISRHALVNRLNKHNTLDTPNPVETHKLVYLTHQGETKTIREWARITGLSISTIKYRLYNREPIEQVLKAELRRKYITYQGVTRTFSEWAKITGVSVATIKYRLYAGKSAEEILSPTIRGKQ